MSLIFISCKEATALVEKNNLKKTTFLEKAKLYFHLFICKACKIYENNSQKLDKIIRAKIGNKKLSNTQKSTILENIKKS